MTSSKSTVGVRRTDHRPDNDDASSVNDCKDTPSQNNHNSQRALSRTMTKKKKQRRTDENDSHGDIKSLDKKVKNEKIDIEETKQEKIGVKFCRGAEVEEEELKLKPSKRLIVEKSLDSLEKCPKSHNENGDDQDHSTSKKSNSSVLFGLQTKSCDSYKNNNQQVQRENANEVEVSTSKISVIQPKLMDMETALAYLFPDDKKHHHQLQKQQQQQQQQKGTDDKQQQNYPTKNPLMIHHTEVDSDREWLYPTNGISATSWVQFRVAHEGDISMLATLYRSCRGYNSQSISSSTTTALTATTDDLEWKLTNGFGDEQTPPSVYAIIAEIHSLPDNKDDKHKSKIKEETRKSLPKNESKTNNDDDDDKDSHQDIEKSNVDSPTMKKHQKMMSCAAFFNIEWDPVQCVRVLHIIDWLVSPEITGSSKNKENKNLNLLKKRMLFRLSALALATGASSILLSPNFH